MTLHDLVQLVATNTFFLGLKAPRDERVLEALSRVDRQQFIPATLSAMENVYASYLLLAQQQHAADGTIETKASALAYNDVPLPIGDEQTCSQPSMVGFMCDILNIEPGMRILEIGTGCGYHAAVTAELVGEQGQVVSIECIPRLADLAWKNLQAHFGENLASRLTLLQGDGSVGVPEQGFFDRIYFTAAVQREKFDPAPFTRTLVPHGILLYPEQQGSLVREVYSSRRVEDSRVYGPVCFVPLCGENGGRDERALY